MNFHLQALGLICAAGDSPAALREALVAAAPGGVASEPWRDGRQLHLGRVRTALPTPTRFPSRNNALLLAALAPIRAAVDAALARHGPLRVALVLGTSTSGVGESERDWQTAQQQGRLPARHDLRLQEIGNPAALLAAELGVQGPAYVVSTACSSSAKALASAARLLRAGLADAVICGGADSLCDFTVAGFAALDAVSSGRCNPMSANRSGINIGEGAALFLMGREAGELGLRLAGWGETSDAHHISAPEPEGRGAETAMRAALAMAGLQPADLDYLNLHGTATPHNDAMESAAVARVFGLELPCSSTKPLTGHTLGAAGALEAAIACLALTDAQSRLPVHHFDGERDALLAPIRLVRPGEHLGRRPRSALSNSFAFGGSNAALLLMRDD